MFQLILFIPILLALLIGEFIIGPWLNKHFFSFIWSEEEKPIIKREVQERLEDLFVDGDVPDETALVMAAKEANMDEQELLNMFNAVSPKDLKRIMTGRDNKLMKLYKVLDMLGSANKRGMRRR